MIPSLEPEDIENMVMYQRSPERRSGIDRREGRQMRKKELRQTEEQGEQAKTSSGDDFVGEFG